MFPIKNVSQYFVTLDYIFQPLEEKPGLVKFPEKNDS